jgi:RNA polymerase sigma-70 factor (sigma-E family)
VKAEIPNAAKDSDLLIGGLSNRRPAGAPDPAGTSAGTGPAQIPAADARTAVTALYQVHAVGLIRLAVIMIGDRQAAEDVVQEAFCGLFRRWAHLADKDKALSYVRAAALNGCRSELRRRIRSERRVTRESAAADAESAEYAALVGEEHREVLAALRRLPGRQREALVLRFYLDLSEPEVAAAMGISQGTVKSTTSRALAALGRHLKGDR